MLDVKKISPLLDNIIIGDPISDHHGIQCCPALNQDSGQRYIVKIISVPASQTQLDALLLTGAAADNNAARDYFQERVNDYINEIEIIQELSRYEGFISDCGYQAVPKEDGIGFDIYVLSQYRRSLERQFIKKPLTQLDAMNLGLDICSALTACRRNGYIFSNLKPTNIYITENGEYKISDFGFIGLKSLKYATIAEHYIGAYTAPEITDAFSSLNDRIDVYSIGMILYRIFNGGLLPEGEKTNLNPPAYADPELAQIILKACEVQPNERWHDPAEMGQMLVSYMQKYGVLDIPIVPPAPETDISEAEIDSTDNNSEGIEDSDDYSLDLLDEIIAEGTLPNSDAAEDDILIFEKYTDIISDSSPEPMQQENELEFDLTPQQNDTEVTNHQTSLDECISSTDITDISEVAGNSDCDAVVSDSKNTELLDQETPSQEQESQEIFIQVPSDVISGEKAFVQTEKAEEFSGYTGVTEEVNDILSRADSLASMDVPEPVVAPEIPEIEIPTPTDEFQSNTEAFDDENEDKDEEDTEMSCYVDEPEVSHKSYRVRNIILIALAVGILVGGFLFFKFYIQQTVENISPTGTNDQLTVRVDSKIDEKLLSVSCTDLKTSINITVPVINGEANFSGLAYGSEYSIEVKIRGMHLLTGDYKARHTTPYEIKIDEYSIKTGEISGTAVLKLAISAPSSTQTKIDAKDLKWRFTYSTPGTEPKTASFEGDQVTISDLLEGKPYTGVLELESNNQYASEPITIPFTPAEIVKAYDLTITGCTNGKLTAQWTGPESVRVNSWDVRCYNGIDYDESFSTNSTWAEFTGLNSDNGFTVEVSAAGQSFKQTATVGANSVTVSNISAESSLPGVIDLKWDSSSFPANGWIVSYNVDDCESVVRVTGNSRSAQLTAVIPDATYSISILSGDSVQTLCKVFEYTTPKAENFSLTIDDSTITANDLKVELCKRPSNTNWTYLDVSATDYTSQFGKGQIAGMVILLNGEYNFIYQEISVAYVIYDKDGKIISINNSELNWKTMWIDNYCHLDVPILPESVGNYSISLYFNGTLVKSIPFTIG